MRSSAIAKPILIAAFAVASNAQSVEPAGTVRRERNPDQEAYRQLQVQRQMENRQQRIMLEGERLSRLPSREELERAGLSPEERRRFRQLMEPSAEDRARYASLLRTDRTGIFKMFPYSECTEPGVIRLGAKCADQVPGGSSARLRAKATTPDLHYKNGLLIAEGFFSQIVITDLGAVPIEEVTLETAGIGGLREFKPARDVAAAREQVRTISAGYSVGGFNYGRTAPMRPGHSYAVRIVAYRNTNNLLSRFGDIGLVLGENSRGFEAIRNDDRTDVIVAFHVIRKEPNGAISIVWRELQRAKSPVLNFPKGEQMRDIR